MVSRQHGAPSRCWTMIGGRAALLFVGMSLAACAAATTPSAPTPTSTTGGSAPASGAAPTAPPARSFTMVFTGDLLLHSRVNAVARANAPDDPA